jgi:glycosyltransferase involved in cell wall biosynthesis
VRVLQVNKFYDLRGGTERILFDLGAELRDDGHEVAVFATREESNVETPWREYFAAERNYVDPSVFDKLGYALSTIYDRKARRSFARILDEFRPDVVHLHNIYHQLSPSILDELRPRSIAAVMTLHDYKLACPVYRLFRDGQVCEECVGTRTPLGVARHACSRGSLSESLLLAAESTAHRWRGSYERSIQRFISPSHFLADMVRRQGIAGAQLEVIANAPRRHTVPAPFDRRDVAPTVLCATRLSEEKGIHVLLEAARELPMVQIRIAGEGPQEADLRQIFGELSNVHWLGKLDGEELQIERERCWAVAVPSIWYENAPLAAIEAFHSARPVLAADHGGLVEMVEEGQQGWRIAPADVAAWSAALRRLCEGRELMADMGERAAARARQDYSFDRFYRQHLELYQKVMAEVGRS